jgi:prevent-host-death family protein
MRASAKELRTKSNRILEAVSRGEEVVITYRGKARARIICYEKPQTKGTGKHKLFGIWADNSTVADVDRYVRELRERRF